MSVLHRSRCAKFRFLPLSDESIHSRLKFIAEKENVPISQEICEALTETSGGDMRKAITYFQNAVHLYGGEDLTANDIYDVAGVVPPSAVEPFWKVRDPNRATCCCCLDMWIPYPGLRLAFAFMRRLCSPRDLRLWKLPSKILCATDTRQRCVLNVTRHSFPSRIVSRTQLPFVP